jgi:amidohydrolase
MQVRDRIEKLSSELFPEIREIRRHIHKNPELSFKEYNTSLYIQQQLSARSIEFKTGIAGTGIVGLVRGKNPGTRTVLLRADMDALPILEENKCDYRSINEGVMHACGHDVHSACLLGASFILNELKSEFSGTVKLMFQPGEEVLPGGASLMIAEGVLENPKVDKALALHVFPSMEAGKAGFRKGMYMASTDELYVTVNGKGGHAAMAGEYVNPLIAASAFILKVEERYMKKDALKKTAGENVPTVIAFGKAEAAGATNIIPRSAHLAGTLRTMDEDWRSMVHSELHRIARDISEQFGASIEVRIEKGYPVLNNDPALTQQCELRAREYLGKDQVEELPLRMTAEDFAWISQKVPSCFFRLGTGNREKGINSGVHTSTFNIDERALETGMGLMAWLAISELGV